MTEPADPPRVLLISAIPPPPGGIESWTSYVLRAASSFGFLPTLLNVRSPQPDRGDEVALYKLGFGLRLLRQCRTACDPEKIDVVHINCSVRRWSAARDYWFLRIAQARGIPVIVHLRGGFAGGREWATYPRLAQRFYRMLLSRADAVIVLADEVMRDLASAGIELRRVEKLPNFLPPDWDAGEGGVENRGGVLYTGRLMAEKGTRALVCLAERLPDVDFHWVGRLCEPLDIPPNVTWHGEVAQGQLVPYYRRCSVFLFPTFSEGFPNSVLEAMASGMAVVSTRRGAIPEMIEEGRGGFVCEPEEIDEMALQVEKLIRDPALCARLGDFNRQRAQGEYSIDEVLPRLAGLYRDLALRG